MRTPTRLVHHDGLDAASGTQVRVLDLQHPDSPYPPGVIVLARNGAGEPVKTRQQRWGVECVDHDVLVRTESLSDARSEAEDAPMWCTGCRPAS